MRAPLLLWLGLNVVAVLCRGELPPDQLISDFVPPAGRGCPASVREGPCGKRLLLARSADGLNFFRTYRILTDQADVPDMVVDQRGWIYVYYVGTNVGRENNKIAVAISPDYGEHWVFKRVIIEGFSGLSDPVDPDIQLLPDGTFRLYVTASRAGEPPKTWLAEGRDGVRFTFRGLAFAPPGNALDPSVVRIGDTWHIFAGGGSRPGSNWHGVSTDGVRFDYREELLLQQNGMSQAISNVVAVAGGWRMFTFSHPAPHVIYSFFSADGHSWIPEPGVRLGLEETPLESNGVKDAAVAQLADGSWLMVYVTEIGPTATSSPNCWRASVGLIPLDALGQAHYRGFAGGLYGDGLNVPPPAHMQAGLEAALQIVPRGPSGAPDPNGRIVLLSIGMSNTTQEFSVFRQMALKNRELNPRLVIVDGAQGGWSADRIVAAGEPFWVEVEQRLRGAGVTAQQVQVVWLKEADAGPRLPFPDHALRLKDELKAIVLELARRFPNLRQVWLSSRIYAGYATTELNPEPYAYESAFAVRWLIEEQLAGNPELDYRSGRAPWLAWGPYLWADGLRGRSDGLVWACSDFATDGTHPSMSGREKVAHLLMDFFSREPAARSWFLATASPGDPPLIHGVVHAANFTPELAPGTLASIFGQRLALRSESAEGLPSRTWLGGTAVMVDGELVPLYWASPEQINFFLPPWAGEKVTIRVVRTDGAVASATIFLQGLAPGLFRLSPFGLVAALDTQGRVVGPDNPARRGDIVQLFGTGFRAWHPFVVRPVERPVVYFGGVPAEVVWFGACPLVPGLDQINVRVPLDCAVGSAIPIRVNWRDRAAPELHIPIR